MIYFLVNNDYQLIDARNHAQALKKHGFESCLIEVPHNLREIERDNSFCSYITIQSPVKVNRWVRAWIRYYKAYKDVQNYIKAKPNDVLFLYTEYELLNHFIIHWFKRANATVLLLEDGGVGTYIPFALKNSEKLSLKESLIACMTRCLPGLYGTNFHKVNGIVFPWVKDHYLDGLCFYRSVKTIRKIPVYLLSPPVRKSIDVIKGRVLFLNERIYDNYQTSKEYLDGVEKIMTALEEGFDEVYFKFHPREDIEWRLTIKKLLQKKFPSVHIIESDRAAELLLLDLRPETVASYFSTTLLSLDGTGVEPLFLFHLLPELRCQKVFSQLYDLLLQWDCNFVDNWAGVKTGYRSNIQLHTHEKRSSISDVIRTAHESEC